MQITNKSESAVRTQKIFSEESAVVLNEVKQNAIPTCHVDDSGSWIIKQNFVSK